MPFAEAFKGDDLVWSPGEGNLDDEDTRQALFDILTRHTTPGSMCTVFHWEVGPRIVDSDVLRGPLSAWPELYRNNTFYSPQNIWPDTHQWVLDTDPDSWATSISGPTELIEDLMRSPLLEVLRPQPGR